MAEPGLLLGLDAGNTVIKAVLFDRTGRQLAASQRNGASLAPAPGHVERDMEELWSNAAVVIRECLEKAGVGAAAVAAVGCAGHGNGLYLLDRGGGPLLAIQSLDMRAARLAEELRADGNGARLHAICLQEPWPSQTPTLLAWVRRHAPEVYARCGTAFFCKDFVTFRLTGRRVSDISDMSGAGFVRLPDGAYDAGLLEGYGLADAIDLLPELLGPTDIVGGVTAEAAAATGLAEGTPVVAGLFDVVASALGSGASAPGEASIIAGTWSINQVIAAEAIVDPSVFMVSALRPGPVHGDRVERHLRRQPRMVRARAGRAWRPSRGSVRRLQPPRGRGHAIGARPLLPSRSSTARARAPSCAQASTVSPAGTARAICCARSSRGSPSSTGATSMSCAAPASASTPPRSRAAAPAAQVWPQMFADVLGIPITVAACAETGALGAAIAAGVGAGVFPDLRGGRAGDDPETRRLHP